MRRGSAVFVILFLSGLFVAPGHSGGTDVTTEILSQELFLADWGMKDVSEIKAGQMGILHETPNRLDIQRLRKNAPFKKIPEQVKNQTPNFKDRFFLVSHFDEGNQNRLSGYFNVYKRQPSTASCGIEQGPDGRRALTLRYRRAETGFCGMWVHFFNLKLEDAERIYLNSEPFAHLTFWVRGSKGGEKILLKISDAAWDRKEDALPVGEVADFIESGRIDTSWQLVRVPLTSLPDGINRRELAGLIFHIPEESAGAVHIKTLALVTEGGTPPKLLKSNHPSQPAFSRGDGVKNQATWVWETTRILGSPGDQKELLDFMLDQKINHLFLQIPNEPDKLGPNGSVRIEAEKMRPFLAMFNKKGIKVHALDGWKNFALPEYHDTVLGTIRNVIQYNRASDTMERFYGFHYDIEPYLLAGFGGARARRDWILRNYLAILKKSKDLAHSAGMVYGCDIPFWFDSPDDFTNEYFIVKFDGQSKFVNEHVIDLMDNVGIMDYRTVAYGADGIIAHASGELEYASKTKKPIFVGLETFALPDETLWMFRTPPQRGQPILASGTFLFAVQRSDTAATFYFVPDGKLEEFIQRMKNMNIPLEGDHADRPWYWRLKENIFVPSSKVTFAGMDSKSFWEAFDQAVFELNRNPAFYGMAIHYYETYRDLLRGGKD